MSADYCRPGEVRQIGGHPFVRQPDATRYRYGDGASRCPCGGLGIPWRGWFTCDDCGGRALVDTGEFFLPQGEQPA